MRFAICLAAAVALSGMAAAAHPKPAFEIKSTSWTFTDHGQKMRESVDAKGVYVANTIGGKHVDHGTARMKGGKACFTSAMTKDGEVCWTTKPVKIGQSMHIVSNKGEKLTVTRIKYVPLTMK